MLRSTSWPWKGWPVPLVQAALVEDVGDLALGVVVEEFVDGGDRPGSVSCVARQWFWVRAG